MGFILVLHIIICVLLVITILMQAGRGGGLAESFSSAESMFGTQTNKFMVRVSTVLASLFVITSLVLAFYSSKKDKSLMANKHLLPKVEQTKQGTAVPAAQQPSIVVSPAVPLEKTTAPANAPKP